MSDQEERKPPNKIRISKLQEVHVGPLKRIDRECAEQYWELGFDAAEVPIRTTEEFYVMPKFHAVRVAEADYETAGFAAWRDEAPGIIYLEEIAVEPAMQRFGVGRKLMERLFEEAKEGDFGEVVLRSWKKAEWAQAFYKKLGFKEIGDDAPPKVKEWLEEKTAGGRPFLRPGEVALWAPIPRDAADDD
ncbi:MAG: GNAT family N-acetyltransferase [Polyangiaceae bacterium]|jgi:GNAT superfamily N-acetyltransferase|nr:GNAT family N-acetyltransferase [Polyangiaceae bacterium]MBK8936410.1 GNAT family N-acetyltransferase [Polyangiaceae bacterium]